MDSLTSKVNALWRADIPTHEKRRLTARVFLTGQQVAPQDTKFDILSAYEDLLHTVSSALGAERLSVSEVKNRLRGRHGAGRQLASQLSKFSKLRNCAAHPFPNL